jgi:hypothetical protein
MRALLAGPARSASAWTIGITTSIGHWGIFALRGVLVLGVAAIVSPFLC